MDIDSGSTTAIQRSIKGKHPDDTQPNPITRPFSGLPVDIRNGQGIDVDLPQDRQSAIRTAPISSSRPSVFEEGQDDPGWGSDFEDESFTAGELAAFELRFALEGWRISQLDREFAKQQRRASSVPNYPPPPPRRQSRSPLSPLLVPTAISQLHSTLKLDKKES